MDSREIIRQYQIGAMKAETCFAELDSLVSGVDPQEAARARYAQAFIQRVLQFRRDEVSIADLCLNIRDLSLVFGRIRLSDKLYQAVRSCASDFDLHCEQDNHISAILKIPEWLNPREYVKEVYSLTRPHDQKTLLPSAGDKTLSRYTVFTNYKSFEQKIAIKTALQLPAGNTLLISLPTGGGKSLVTQLLASTSAGLTLVIVPTVALALDQYSSAKRNLREPGRIDCYRGDIPQSERDAIVDSLNQHRTSLLFTSPEAILKNQELRHVLDEAACSGYLKNVVVDEAHIVPDWGVFFRPDFQLFSILLRRWRQNPANAIRTYLLSATLSDDVVDTLFRLFGTQGKNVQVRCDALRQEPRFYFRSVKSPEEQTQKVMEAIRLLPKPMVVYVLEPREAIRLKKTLSQAGFRNIPVFSGETKEQERKSILNGWKQGEYDVVLATSAFGIGVDKPDVRTILHACCPENLSRFYQEVGRAGRDGLPSISLFIPFQSRHGSEGDIRRALGLVKSRVLTVERSIIRWNSMINHPTALVDMDTCVLNTSAPPSSMTEEEARFTGTQNVSWNVNLLLFLYRIGFIDLIDMDYIFDMQSKPPRKYYSVTVKLLKPELFVDPLRLENALSKPRDEELEAQMAGYRIMRDLIASPDSQCWGHVFKHLFPLAREVCNGCPADPEGRVTIDARYQLRTKPDLILPPTKPNRRLSRRIGSYETLIVRCPNAGLCTAEEVRNLAEKADQNEIGVLVVPDRLISLPKVDALLMNYEEFFFAVEHCPYLFSAGVMCLFEDDVFINDSLYRSMEKLKAYHYLRILYCREGTMITSCGKPVRECTEGYIVPVEKM